MAYVMPKIAVQIGFTICFGKPMVQNMVFTMLLGNTAQSNISSKPHYLKHTCGEVPYMLLIQNREKDLQLQHLNVF